MRMTDDEQQKKANQKRCVTCDTRINLKIKLLLFVIYVFFIFDIKKINYANQLNK